MPRPHRAQEFGPERRTPLASRGKGSMDGAPANDFSTDGMSSQSPTVSPTAIETPCVQVCEIDNGLGLCKGCGRTLAEVAAWSRLTVAMRRQIMEHLPHRLASAFVAPPAGEFDTKGRN